MNLLDVLQVADLVDRYAPFVALLGIVLAAVGLYGMQSWRKANRVLDLAREDAARARFLEERNGLLDGDLMAVAAEVDGKEWRP